MRIEITGLEPGHRTEWAVLWQGYQDFYKVALPSAVTETTWARLLDPAEPVHGLGAVSGATLLGFAHFLTHRSTWMTADTCYLQDLYVVPEARGTGIARRLLEAVYIAADKAGAGQVYWLTHHSNAQARRLYDRLATNAGFIVYERHAETPG